MSLQLQGSFWAVRFTLLQYAGVKKCFPLLWPGTMIMKRKYLHIFFLVVVVFGCAKHEPDLLTIEESHIYRLGSTFCETKTHFNQRLNLLWDKGDIISLFDGTSLNQKFKFDGETNDNSGTFSKVENQYGTGLDLYANYAIYPYNKLTSLSEDENNRGLFAAVLPQIQHYGNKSFGVNSSTMVAATNGIEDLILRFKNVCGWIRIQLYVNNSTVRSIELKSNNGEKISGPATIVMSYDPVCTVSEEGYDNIVLDCGVNGVQVSNNSAEPTIFWFSVPPITLEKGFTITIVDNNGYTMQKSTTKSYSVTRNIARSLSAFLYTPTPDAIFARERNALIALYNSLGGEQWTNKENWCSEEPVGNWEGVTMDESGFVVGIDLASNNLQGAMPDAIGDFSKLTTLDLSGNSISGTFPDGICRLTSLENLNLADNSLSGSIPNDIGNLSEVVMLDLSGNSLSGSVPESYG